MKGIEINLSSLKEIKPHEYAMRFVFGGLATVAAGLIARKFGPALGGLFLAFPAIFPASATLIENHEKEHKAAIGSDGRTRGRLAASLDSLGASMGCIGLIAFAVLLWKWLDNHNAWLTISTAAALWLATAYLLWALREHRPRRRNIALQK
jgi:Protein of unknown function (DUF3147)